MPEFLNADQLDALADIAFELEEAMREADQADGWIGIDDQPVSFDSDEEPS